MKKFLTLIICLACGTATFAQKTNEVLFSIGAMSYDNMAYDTPYYYDYLLDLYDAYETHYRDERYSALLNLEYHRFLTNRFSLGACAACCFGSVDLYDPIEDSVIGTRSINNLYLTARLRYCYQRTERGELYSGASLGIKHTFTADTDQRSSFYSGLAGEFIPIGLAYGRKVPVYVEIVFGNTQATCRFGIGYRF